MGSGQILFKCFVDSDGDSRSPGLVTPDYFPRPLYHPDCMLSVAFTLWAAAEYPINGNYWDQVRNPLIIPRYWNGICMPSYYLDLGLEVGVQMTCPS